MIVVYRGDYAMRQADKENFGIAIFVGEGNQCRGHLCSGRRSVVCVIGSETDIYHRRTNVWR